MTCIRKTLRVYHPETLASEPQLCSNGIFNLLKSTVVPPKSTSRTPSSFPRSLSPLGALQSRLPLHSCAASVRLTSCLGADSTSSRLLSRGMICSVGIKLCSCRFHSTNFDLKKLRPMILKRIEQRSGFYPVKDIIPVARSVLQARSTVVNGVSLLLNHVPVLTCKFFSEVYIGENGHLIRTCFGPKRLHKNKFHQWINGGLNDIIVPVETFHLDYMFQGVIKHDERFDFDRIPAVVELCWQAGADPEEKSVENPDFNGDDLTSVAIETLRAWEFLRSGVEKLLLTYPAKVCKHCSEVHIGPSGHKARLCGVFKYERWRGAHFWEKAKVDDLVPPKVVWRRRPQDPPVLVQGGQGFYGRAPAVVELCGQAGAKPPVKYHYMMKVQGLAAPL